LPDPHNNLGLALLELGRMPAALAQFEDTLRLRPEHAEAQYNRGLALNALGRGAEALAAFETSATLRPGFMPAQYNRALMLAQSGRSAEALAVLDGLIAQAAGHAEALNLRGVVMQDLRRAAEALPGHDRAVALAPDRADFHANRGNALLMLGRPDQALACQDHAIELNANFVAAHCNRGNALMHLHRRDEALASYDRALSLAPDHADTKLAKAYCLLTLGQYAEGWKLHEARWLGRHGAARGDADKLWLGREDIAGKTLFLHGEQGMGDTIQFARYATLAAERGAHVVLSVQQPLVRLLCQLAPSVTVLGSDEAPDSYDFHAPLLSLPLAFATTLDTIPPATLLHATPSRGAGRIGIAWRGNPLQANDHNRSMKLAALRDLLRPDLSWVALQNDRTPEEAAVFAELPQLSWIGDELHDLADTASVIAGLDLVISVDTVTAHLAATMGKPTWVLLCHNADWRWLPDRADSPWYPTARLFRQDTRGDWACVIAAVAAALDQSAAAAIPVSAS